jgi:pantothenate kinase type III
MHLLTGDLGNSRCKLRLWTVDGEGTPQRILAKDFDTAPGIGAEVSKWIETIPRMDAAALCSVASAELEHELDSVLDVAMARGAKGARRGRTSRPDPGLSVACREPESVGRDRLFAARGALEACGESAIVVDAGTALTVDAVRADGTFLGGAIAPGPTLLARALSAGTARLPRIEPRPGVPALGDDTQAALRSGVLHGFRGAARELADRIAEESRLTGAPVVLTGGARRYLLDPSVFAGRRLVEEADLVHHGLLAAWAHSRNPGSNVLRIAPRIARGSP